MQQLNFPIIDPHIHQWDPWTTPRAVSGLVKLFRGRKLPLEIAARLLFPKPLLDSVGKIDHVIKAYLPADYAADTGAYEVSHIVNVEAAWEGKKPLSKADESAWVETLDFPAHGIQLGAVVGAADPEAPEFADLLAAHAEASPRLRGIRAQGAWDDDRGLHNFHEHPGRYRNAAFLKGFSKLAEAGLRFDAWVFSPQLGDVQILAQEYPEVPIVLDHLGSPLGLYGPIGRRRGSTETLRAELFAFWQHSMAKLAELPNVHVKVSGLLMSTTGHGLHLREQPPGEEEIAELIAPVVNHALDVFGPERCMWASNFPMDKITASLETVIGAYARVVGERGDDALRQVFRQTALDFYGIAA